MRLVLVLVLVLLAGCSGLLDGVSDTETASVTPAPVPEQQAPVDLPTTEDGRPAVSQILADYRRALATRSFHRRVVINRGWADSDVWVDRTTGRYRVRRTVSNTTDDAVIVDGRQFERQPNGTVTNSSARRGLPYVDSTSGIFLLQQYVAGFVYERTGPVRRNGTRLARLEANTTGANVSRSGFRSVTAADSQLYVDRNGVVRRFVHREWYAGGSVRTVRMQVTVDIGSIPLPPWFDRRPTSQPATATQ